MALTSDNIETIKLFADKLEKWANNLSYSKTKNKNLWVELILFFYPQNLQVAITELANIPEMSRTVQKNFEELAKIIHKIDIWHDQGVCQEEFGEFITLFDKLKEIALNIVFSLRKISNADRSDYPRIETAVLKKSKSSELRETELGRKGLKQVTAKIPPKEALMAYHLHYEMNLPRSQVAKRITSELKLGKPVRLWEVSRWIKQVENWRIHTGLPVDSVLKKTVNPAL